MKTFCASLLLLLACGLVAAQNEQSPLVEKEITYKNWNFKDILTGSELSLRNLSAGNKLVMVVYFAPWCPNWRHDAPIVERLYETYKSNGLQVVGVGEYGAVDSIKSSLDELKVTFPVVYESKSRDDRQKTSHYEYRKSTGDTRNWGSPWYVFLESAKLETEGEVLSRKTNVVNGEIIESQVEKMVREKLGLPASAAPASTLGKSAEIEPCSPDEKKPVLGKP